MIALFPLPNVVLFPGVDLPLHIFEPRYREMARDVMEGDRRIGMVLLRDAPAEPGTPPAIFPHGCVGRVEEFRLLPDGRSNLVLRGESVFEVVSEDRDRSYRRAHARVIPDSGEVTDTMAGRIRTAVEGIVRERTGSLPDGLWDQIPGEGAGLVNTVAYSLGFSMVEKQSLLGCRGLPERAERLLGLLEFQLLEAAGDAGSSGTVH